MRAFARSSRPSFSVAVAVWLAWAALSTAAGGRPPAALKIVVIEGEDAVNVIQQGSAVAPLVEVRDENDQPVAGVLLTFSVRGGSRARLAGNLDTLTVTTDVAGRGRATALIPTGRGPVTIDIRARYQNLTTMATISQTNVMTAADVVSTARGSAGASRGISARTIGILAGAGAAGSIAALRALDAAETAGPPGVPGAPGPAPDTGADGGGTPAPAPAVSCSYTGLLTGVGTHTNVGQVGPCTWDVRLTLPDATVGLSETNSRFSAASIGRQTVTLRPPCFTLPEVLVQVGDRLLFPIDVPLTRNGDVFQGSAAVDDSGSVGDGTATVTGTVAGGRASGSYGVRYSIPRTGLGDPRVGGRTFWGDFALDATFSFPASCSPGTPLGVP